MLVVAGPTGVGKTELAVELCRRHQLHLISADSRQIYCWLDIGTAKPDRTVLAQVSVHMVDIVEPNQRYTAADYARDARAVMRRLTRQNTGFIVAGGSGLYLKALFQPFFETPGTDPARRQQLTNLSAAELYERLRQVDPDRAAMLHPRDRQRVMRALEVFETTGQPMSQLLKQAVPAVEFEPVYVILTRPRAELYRRIDERFDEMMKAGLLDEVRRLKEAGFGRDTYVANAYGYAELLSYIEGELTLEQAVALAKAKTRAYARRQLTWFRGLKQAHWFEIAGVKETADQLEPLLEDVLD
ncbi:MAG: tRNA (adenosine(37)-N6)-dimethylallyltransferase MiaA [candidate division WOR-3 bacterium]